MKNGLKALLLVFVLAWGGCSLLLIMGQKSPAERAEEKCRDTVTAYVMSQHFIKDKLRAPSTANFPWSDDPGVHVTHLGDCIHEVSAFVDAENGFGAYIRTPYYVKLQNKKGTDTWTARAVLLGHSRP